VIFYWNKSRVTIILLYYIETMWTTRTVLLLLPYVANIIIMLHTRYRDRHRHYTTTRQERVGRCRQWWRVGEPHDCRSRQQEPRWSVRRRRTVTTCAQQWSACARETFPVESILLLLLLLLFLCCYTGGAAVTPSACESRRRRLTRASSGGGVDVHRVYIVIRSRGRSGTFAATAVCGVKKKSHAACDIIIIFFFLHLFISDVISFFFTSECKHLIRTTINPSPRRNRMHLILTTKLVYPKQIAIFL